MKRWPAVLHLPCLLLGLSGSEAFAQINITSANGHPWDLDNSTGYIGDGGGDAFDDFGYLGLLVRDAGDVFVGQTNTLSGFNLVTSEGNSRLVFSTASQSVGGVVVSRQLYMPPGSDFIRYFDTFVNTTAAPLKIQVAFQGDLGSDSSTKVAATSSGDLQFTPTDIWGVTVQDRSATGGSPVGDPVVGMLPGNLHFTSLADAFGSDPFSTAWPGNGSDGLSFVYSLDLAPGQSSSLVFFIYRGLAEGNVPPLGADPVAVGTQVSAAVSALDAMLANPDLSQLSAQQIAQIANLTAVPEPSTWVLLASGGFLLFVGAWRRRSAG